MLIAYGKVYRICVKERTALMGIIFVPSVSVFTILIQVSDKYLLTFVSLRHI